MKEVSVVGIAGGTASGKSTIVSYIKEFFKDGSCRSFNPS